jgi:hypothetical protein
MSEREILRKVRNALKEFFQEEQTLLDVNASERSLSHKFAEHLQKQFPNLDVDCEYNRHGNDIKRLKYCLPGSTEVDNLEAKTVFPDVVVHKRRNDKNNSLVIEIKKSNSGQDHTADLEKLKAFTGSQYKYKVGLFLLIDVEGKCLSRVRYFTSGKEVGDINGADRWS